MTDVTEQQWLRDAFNDIAARAAVDPDADRPIAWHALRHQTRRRTQRRIGSAFVAVAAVAALVAVIAWPGGDGHEPFVKTVKPSAVPKIDLVAKFAGASAPDPIAYDGHDVWLARKDYDTRPKVVVERRDAASGAVLSSIDVRQETVFSIAADGAGSVWIAGGGDGGVPQTTVSRINTETDRVVLTHTLEPQSCSCLIVAGAGGVWLGANGDGRILRLNASTATVAVETTLPSPARSLAIVGDRLQVGLDDSRIAVIDPATNRVERLIPVTAPALPAFGAIVSLDSVAGSPGDSWATRSDGYAFPIEGNEQVSAPARSLLRPLGVVAAAVVGDRIWAVGADQLLFVGIGRDGRSGLFNYDPEALSFGPVVLRTQRLVASVEPEQRLYDVVAAGATLWIAGTNGVIFVVRT